MKSDRLLSILLLLQARGLVSARLLAEQLEVSERTIHRDLAALSAAGVPVYTERGRNGGCALLPGYRTDVSGLTAGEARALFVFAGRGTLADLGLERELRGALRKLMAALPEARRPEAAQAQERVLVDPRGWMRAGEDLPHLGTVQEAVWADRGLWMRYRSAGGSAAWERVVDPYGLVSKAGVWYLIAASGGEPRLYRVSRIEAAELTEKAAARPAGLDLERLWEELRRRVEDRGEGVEVTVAVRPDRVDMVLRLVAGQLIERAAREAGTAAAGWPRLRMRFPAQGAARGALLGFGTEVEVLEPTSLRAELAEVAAALKDLYGGG